MPRPRKAGLREPNGRPSRSDRVVHIQRKLDAVHKLALDAELGTALGILLLWESITKHQYEAGLWFAEARKAADAALQCPPRNPPAQNPNAVRGASCDDEGPDQITRKRRVVETYARAEALLGVGTARLKAVLWVCVHDRRPDTEEQRLALAEGLDVLVALRSVRRAA
jgi:hypothetical protein